MLGEEVNTYGRIHKSLHVLALIDDEDLRRGIKGIRNLQEGRHRGRARSGTRGRRRAARRGRGERAHLATYDRRAEIGLQE